MRTQVDRNLDNRQKMVARIDSLYRQARMFHWTHTELLDRYRTDVLESPAYRKNTQVNRAFVQGYRDALDDALWLDMVWRLGPAEGPCRNAHTEWTEQMSELSQAKALYGGHFWKDAPESVFTEYKAL